MDGPLDRDVVNHLTQEIVHCTFALVVVVVAERKGIVAIERKCLSPTFRNAVNLIHFFGLFVKDQPVGIDSVRNRRLHSLCMSQVNDMIRGEFPSFSRHRLKKQAALSASIKAWHYLGQPE